MNDMHILCAIGVTSLVTIFLRFAPFLIFREKIPKMIEYLGKVLPEAIMAMLVVYCLKNVSFVSETHAMPEIISLGSVFALHKWKHNTLLSILIGTIIYMVLIQFIFI